MREYLQRRLERCRLRGTTMVLKGDSSVLTWEKRVSNEALTCLVAYWEDDRASI